MKLTFNPTDFKNIVASIGEPPETDDFSTATDESVERGFVRIDGEVHGEPQSDTVPVFLAGIPTEATLSADELADYENSDGGEKCDATAGLEHGVLAYAEDGTTLVVTSDDADVISA